MKRNTKSSGVKISVLRFDLSAIRIHFIEKKFKTKNFNYFE